MKDKIVTENQIRSLIRQLLESQEKIVGQFNERQFTNDVFKIDLEQTSFYIETNTQDAIDLQKSCVDFVNNKDTGPLGSFMENFAILQYLPRVTDDDYDNLNNVLKNYGFTGNDSPGADAIKGSQILGEIVNGTCEVKTEFISVKASTAATSNYEAHASSALQMCLQAYAIVKGNTSVDLNNQKALIEEFLNDSEVNKITLPFGLVFGAWRRRGEPVYEKNDSSGETGISSSDDRYVSAIKKPVAADSGLLNMTAGSARIGVNLGLRGDSIAYAKKIEDFEKRDASFSFSKSGKYNSLRSNEKVNVRNQLGGVIMKSFVNFFNNTSIPISELKVAKNDPTKVGLKTFEYVIQNHETSEILKQHFVQNYANESKLMSGKAQTVSPASLFDFLKQQGILLAVVEFRRTAEKSGAKAEVLHTVELNDDMQPHFQIIHASGDNNSLEVTKSSDQVNLSLHNATWVFNKDSELVKGTESISNKGSNYVITSTDYELFLGSSSTMPVASISTEQTTASDLMLSLAVRLESEAYAGTATSLVQDTEDELVTDEEKVKKLRLAITGVQKGTGYSLEAEESLSAVGALAAFKDDLKDREEARRQVNELNLMVAGKEEVLNFQAFLQLYTFGLKIAEMAEVSKETLQALKSYTNASQPDALALEIINVIKAKKVENPDSELFVRLEQFRGDAALLPDVVKGYLRTALSGDTESLETFGFLNESLEYNDLIVTKIIKTLECSILASFLAYIRISSGESRVYGVTELQNNTQDILFLLDLFENESASLNAAYEDEAIVAESNIYESILKDIMKHLKI